MSPLIVLIGLIVVPICVLALVIWNRRRMERAPAQPLSREKLKNGFTPSARPGGFAFASLGAFISWSAYWMWSNPPHPPFTGRRAWIIEAIYHILGVYGMVACTAAIGLLLIGFGVHRWLEDRAAARAEASRRR